MRNLVESAIEEGRAVELCADGDEWRIVVDGREVTASNQRRAETALAELAVQPWRGRDDISVLIAGLGMGFTLRAVLDQPGVSRVDVIEDSPAVIDWNRRLLGRLNGDAALDPRASVHPGELTAFLQAPRMPPLPDDGWFAIIVDVDEFPTWVARPGNRLLYSDEGIRLLEGALRPGGVLTLWTTERDDSLSRRLHARLQQVSRIAVPTHAGLDYIYRGRRGPRLAS